MICRLRRDLGGCKTTRSVTHTIADIGVTYISTILKLQDVDDEECLLYHVCQASRHVSSLSDTGGVVEILNKMLIKVTSLYLLENHDVDPKSVLHAGNWGRSWQRCESKYKIC